MQQLNFKRRIYGKMCRTLMLYNLRVLRLLAHAFCHLAGYDHETRPEYLRMLKHENQLIRKAHGHCNIVGINSLKTI